MRRFVLFFQLFAGLWLAVQLNAAAEPVAKATYTLTINIAGSGTTTPEAGSHVYDETPLFISAYPASGWAFDHWEGDLTSNEPLNQFVNMNQDKTITAVFVEGGVPLTVAIVGNGRTSPEEGTWNYISGRTVNISAFADYGWVFDHWEGALTSSASSESLVMDAAKNVTAVFTEMAATFTLSVVVNGNGSVEPPAGSHTYASGEGVNLFATPDTGWAFDQWQGDLAGTEPWNQYVTMDSDKTVTAVFVEGGVPLTISVVGNGVTGPPAGTRNYVADRTAYISAQPNAGWAFGHWEGNASGTENSVEVVMDAAKSVTAVFLEERTLTMAVQGIGAVTPAAGAHTYLDGEEVTITAVPEAGWRFDHWEGGLTGSENPAAVTMDADKAITAVFVERTMYTLYTGVNGQGSISPPPVSHDYYEGEQVEITATAGDGWYFDHWDGDLTGSENPATIIMDSNKTVAAVFTLNSASLTVSISGDGSVAPPGTTWHAYGAQVTLTATPSEHWAFVEWQGDLTGSENPAQLVLEGAKSVTAVFAPLEYQLTTNVTGSGTVEPSGATLHAYGSEVTLTATPADGWQFLEWQGEATGFANPVQLFVDGDQTVTAVFTPVNYSLTANVTGNGAVEPSGTTAHAYGSEVTLTATPGEGWEFVEWQGDLTGSVNPAQLLIDGNKTVTAVFQQMTTEGEGEGSEGNPEGITEGEGEGSEGNPEGITEGEGEGSEGNPEGITEGEGEGSEGNPEGDGEGIPEHHSADQDGNNQISLTELLRVIQFFNTGGFHCVTPPATSEDGYLPGAGADHSCAAHSSDYNPLNWQISLTELLRLIQFFNTGAYHACPGQGTEDDYCPGVA